MEHPITPEQSLRLIEETILQAKRSYQKVNFYFLLWGTLFALAGIGAWLMATMGSPWSWVVYPIAGIIGGIMSGVYTDRVGKERRVVTMMDRVHQWLWIGYIVTLLLMLIALVSAGLDPNPYVLLLTGLPTFVSGALMRFRPLVIGGILFWCLGAVSVFWFREYSPLVYSLGIVAGYIIPGLMLKRQEDGLRTA
jgi:MFS family permease